ncbi:hypothetical protein [Mesorhizobium sp. IMUNJ 23232]|uniref:hypothetical protein n=1 Tax=Mesorhizobium sp. IMUNJ 23232 TaxID=3376064 RepID=UPI0037AB2B0F
MINYTKNTDTPPTEKEIDDNRFEQIRSQVADRHRKSDTDGTRRRDRQTAETNRLL